MPKKRWNSVKQRGILFLTSDKMNKKSNLSDRSSCFFLMRSVLKPKGYFTVHYIVFILVIFFSCSSVYFINIENIYDVDVAFISYDTGKAMFL